MPKRFKAGTRRGFLLAGKRAELRILRKGFCLRNGILSVQNGLRRERLPRCTSSPILLEGELFQLVLEQVDVLIPEGAHGHDCLEIIDRRESGDALHELLFLLHGVYLVYCEHDGGFLRLEAFEQLKLRLLDLALRLCHKEADVNAGHSVADGLYHLLAELCLGAVIAGGVGEYELSFALGEHAHYLGAGRLRLLSDYRHLLTEHTVEQRGFADIGAADYRNESCFCHFLLLI